MAKKIISLDELAYFKSLLADVAISGDYDNLEGKPLWIGTQDEYETEASSIPADTVIIITDDNGAVISINYADLTNKPQINGVTLTGNKTGTDLGLVTAETGKGLSSNDYTANDKSKLDGIAAGAQVNVIETVTVNGVAQTITNKTLNLTLGTAAAKNSTSSVTANSTDLVESGAVKSAIDAAMVSAYKAGGSKTCAELTSALLVAENEGYVFTMSDTGTTTSDFIEGAGKEIGVGADVGVIKRNGAYKFNLLPGIIDTSNFINKSATTGLVKNDGSIDTTTYVSDVSGKADKVANATSGNFAGLDANGNLTDSGKKSSDFATSTQGGKADTAIQTIKIGGTAQTKTDGVVDLPAYPTTLPASDTTSTYSATGTAPVNGTAVASAIGALDVNEVGGTGKYISKISETDGKISATAADMPTSLPASDTTDTYSATGTVPVSGTAVAAALGTLDVAEVGGSGKYIQKISETDGKISATSQDLNATAVGLGSVVNTGDSATPVENGTTKFTTGGAYTELAKKVDKVDGKGLSTNDFTTTYKNKLDTLGTVATKNVAASGNASTTEVVMGNDTRLTDSRTPTAHTHTTDNITDFWEGTQAEYEEATIANGSIIVITDDDGNGNPINYTSALNKPQVNGVTLTGNKTSSDLGLVSAVSGKGLSTNDYTTAEKNKLASLVASPVKIVTWADGTDAEIADMVAAAANGSINLRNYWNVGDERVVSLAAMAATGVGESHAAQDVTLVLLNKGGYTDVNGKDVAFVVGLKLQLNEKGYINSTNTTEGGWGGCARRTWCNSVFYNALPSGLKSIFKQVKVPSFPSQFVVEFNSDYVTLPAPSEIIGHLDSSSWSYEPDTDEFANFCCQFEYYKNVYRANTYNPPSVSGTHYDVWTRAFSANASGAFFKVSNRSGMAYYNGAPSDSWGIQPIMFI